MPTLTFALLALLGAQEHQAPELEGGREWFNTDKPLKMAGLKGKMVLLDFWTYC